MLDQKAFLCEEAPIISSASNSKMFENWFQIDDGSCFYDGLINRIFIRWSLESYPFEEFRPA